QGYNPRIAAGVVAAAGALTQIVPPSLSLIVLADQLGRGVGEMYAAALLPAALIIGAYALLVALLVVWRPQWLPAATQREENTEESSRIGALAMLALAGVTSAWVAAQLYPALIRSWGRLEPPADERVVIAVASAVLIVIGIAALDRRFDMGWLSPLARRAVLACAPPLVLIFLVLGTIYGVTMLGIVFLPLVAFWLKMPASLEGAWGTALLFGGLALCAVLVGAT